MSSNRIAGPATGRWPLTPNGGWTGGYWNAMIWLSPHATDAER